VRGPATPARRGERRRTAALLGVVATVGGLALGAIALAGAPVPGRNGPSPRGNGVFLPASPLTARPIVRGERRPRRRHRPERLAPPMALAVPAIGLHAPIVRLGLNPDGTLQVPGDFDAAGWWSGGLRPGRRGPAVIAGHVDSQTGPAVFFRLGSLRRGDLVLVRLWGGKLLRFAVRRVARYPKSGFPTESVYGPTRRSTLRLITCSGDFDRAAGHYVDNTVVYAVRVRGR
jgi:sortase family protein